MNKKNIIMVLIIIVLSYLLYKEEKIKNNKIYHNKDRENYCKDEKNCTACQYYTECYSIFE